MNVRGMSIAVAAAVVLAGLVISPVAADVQVTPAAPPSELACNPKDPRLKGITLPKGRGPEAEAAAACLWLQYLERKNVPVAPIKVTGSPTMPKKFLKTIRKSLETGDRLTGQWADPNRSYEFVMSNDSKWMCKQGKKLVDPRAVGKGAQPQPWAQTFQSGCPGADYAFGAWQGKNLGENGQIYFSWGLFAPEDWKDVLPGANQRGNPIWFFPFATHENQHQLMNSVAYGPSSITEPIATRPMGAPGTWFYEGQAEYIGFMSAEISGARKNMRDFKIEQAKQNIKENGLRDLMVAIDYQPKGFQSPYSGGYFAYEYLLAHYGLEKTVTWWRDWHSGECEMGTFPICWVKRSEELFGMPAEELVDTLNDYIVRQIS